MPKNSLPFHRRTFLKTTPVLALSSAGAELIAQSTSAGPAISRTVLGPRPGYSPQIGTLVSMLDFVRSAPLRRVTGMTPADLDFLFDAKANSIGALLLHLAAADAMYRLSTLEGKPWGAYDTTLKQDWNIPLNLGEPARKAIKGNNLDYYLTALKETRAATLAAFRKRDDLWLMSVDTGFPWGPTNNYCKWFHVCEHESHHDGQIAILKSRIPGAKPEPA